MENFSQFRQITAAKKDISAKGRIREWWYRMVWRDHDWVYLGDRRLSSGTFYAADRRDRVYADVKIGDIILQHDRGGPVTDIFIVHDGEKPLKPLEFRSYDGLLYIAHPSGKEYVLPNPRYYTRQPKT